MFAIVLHTVEGRLKIILFGEKDYHATPMTSQILMMKGRSVSWKISIELEVSLCLVDFPSSGNS